MKHYIILVIALIAASGWGYSQKNVFNQNLKSGDKYSIKRSYQDGQKTPYTDYRAMSVINGAERDNYGNANGNKYDLARDGAFKGLQIAVLHLYTGESFDFNAPSQALKEKGFSIIRWKNTPPSASILQEVLDESCQLWIISDKTRKLNRMHLKVIENFFNSGKGIYIWGDNDPYYADANYVANSLFRGHMSGNIHGDKNVTLRRNNNVKMGIKINHDITTGIENLYEGITIATIKDNDNLSPLLYGSNNNLVAAIYESGNKRAIIDGGFTRLYVKWDTAGTGRYVKNAATWLVNYERFGNSLFK